MYTVNIQDILGEDFDEDSLAVAEAKEQALSVMTKGDYVNKLHDIFISVFVFLHAFLYVTLSILLFIIAYAGLLRR